MPTAMWPEPAAEEPAFDPSVYRTREVRGLGDFLGGGQPDFGAELSDRLGVLAEIFGRLGKGSGMQGISEVVSSMNDRSSARSEKRKMMTMANRFADKLAPTSPELAAMIYANPKFGMELLGKKYEAEWASDNEMKMLEKRLPFELEKAKQVARINGDAEAATRIAILEREYELKQATAARTLDRLRGITGGTGAGTTGSGGGGGAVVPPASAPAVTPAVTAPAPPPVPDAGGPPASALQVDPNTSQPSPGQGTEPAPTQSVVAQPAVQETAQAIPEPVPRVAQVPDSDIKWSGDETGRAIQKSFKERYGASISPVMAEAMVTAALNGDDAGLRELISSVEKQMVADRDYQRAVSEPDVREDVWRANKVEPIQGPDSPLDQSPDLDHRAVLRSSGFTDQGINELGDMAGPLAQTIIQGQRAGGAQPAVATKEAAGVLQKKRDDAAAALPKEAAGRALIAAANATKETLAPGDERSRAILDGVAGVALTDPAAAGKMLGDLSTELQNRVKDFQTNRMAEEQLKIQQAEGARAQETHEAGQQEKVEAEKQNYIVGINQASTMKKLAGQIFKEVYANRENEPTFGIAGWPAGIIPGTLRRRAEGMLTVIKSQLTTGVLAAMKKNSPNGATGFGQLTKPELDMLQAAIVNFEQALDSGENFDDAMKTLWNHYENIINPAGGMRLDTDKEGFVARPFSWEEDNPGLYRWAVENNRSDIIRKSTQSQREGTGRREIAPGVFIENAPLPEGGP